MRRGWLWLAFAVLLAVAAAATWFAFSNPTFVAGLGAVIANAAWAFLAPKIFKRKTPEEEALDGEAYSEGVTRPTKQKPHPDEN